MPMHISPNIDTDSARIATVRILVRAVSSTILTALVDAPSNGSNHEPTFPHHTE